MSDPLVSETVVHPSIPIPPRANRRSGPRLRARGGSKSVCRKGTLGLGVNIGLALLDISETGARLRVKEALRPGQEVEVGLLAPGNVREVKMIGQVVWSVPAADGSHLVGLHFDKPLSFRAVQELGQLANL